MESVPSLGSKAAAHEEPGRGRSPLGDEPQKSSQRGETQQTDAGDRNFMVQRGSGEGGSRGIKRAEEGSVLNPSWDGEWKGTGRSRE